MKSNSKHGQIEQILRMSGPLTIRYVHEIPFWRAVHAEGVLLGGNEGGSSYRVGRDLYACVHNGTDYEHWVAPYYFTEAAAA